ncbi:MAG: cupin domain-containing protein [Bacteroidetes bacterium]|nr:MAG: cupin domain-containing protein [Bacteroidota bacterium]
MSSAVKPFLMIPDVERARFEMSWLQSAYVFSHSSYYNPTRMGFGTLRVLNEEVVSGNAGFTEHEHKNMEVLTLVLTGEMRVESEGKKPIIVGENEIFYLSSGSGVVHAERNNSKTEEMSFIQFYLSPREKESKPKHGVKHFKPAGSLNALQCIASPNGVDSSFAIKQEAYVYQSNLESGKTISFLSDDPENFQFVFVMEGSMQVGENHLEAKDSICLKKAEKLLLEANTDCKFLLMDLPAKAVR